jgi:hypothetical protein
MVLELFRFHVAWPDCWYRINFSPCTRLFLLLLALLCVYAAYSASVSLVCLRYLRKHRTGETDNLSQESWARLNRRLRNLRQMITAMFYLFGVAFFTQIQGAYRTPENNRPVGLMVLENFSVDFSFAAVISLVFLILHSLPWFVSGRIGKTSLRLNSQG